MKCYCVFENIHYSGNDLPNGTRVILMPFYHALEIDRKEYDGPYYTLKQLRKESIKYKKLYNSNPQRAQKICERRFIIEITESILSHNHNIQQFGNEIVNVLLHTITGKIKKGDVSGVHHFNSMIHKVVKETKPPNIKGVWEAQIAKKDSLNNTWIEKEKPSTFFPKHWDKSQLLFEVSEAYRNKQFISPTKAIGLTSNNIKVVFIFKDEKICSVYPEYE